MAIENEIKLAFPGTPEEARHAAQQLGYAIRKPRTLERDTLFDLPDSQLRASDKILRLRTERGSSSTTWTLTYKGPATRDGYKNREEIETGVDNGSHLELILERLGYTPRFRYEKYRTTLASAHEPGIVTVDETPMGIFLELEGPTEWIDSTAKHLGYSQGDYVVLSYASLWREYSEAHGHTPGDMVFLETPPRS